MKQTKKIISTLLAMTVLMGTSALVPVTANAAAINWETISEWAPDWIPTDYISALNFYNLKGATQNTDDIICILKKVPASCEMKTKITPVFKDDNTQAEASYEAKTFTFERELPEEPDPEDEMAYEYYLKEMKVLELVGLVKDGALTYHYETLIIYNNTADGFDIDVSIKDKETGEAYANDVTYSFAKQNNKLVETDVYSWLPDCVPEFEKYTEKYESIELRDGLLVYTGKPYSAQDTDVSTEQTGTGKLKLVNHECLGWDDYLERKSNPNCIVKVYAGETEGDVDIEFKGGVKKASVIVDENLNVVSKEKPLPEWLPRFVEDAVDFQNKHGYTYASDGIICCVRSLNYDTVNTYAYTYSGSAAEEIENYKVFNKLIKHKIGYTTVYYDVTAYDIPAGSDLTVNYVNKNNKAEIDISYSFEKDSEGNVTQTDIYSWLPDSEDEFNQYYQKKGTFTEINGYVLYCNNFYNYSHTSTSLNQTGSGEFDEYYYEIKKKTVDDIVNNTTHRMVLFKPAKEGAVKIDMSKVSKYERETRREDDRAYYKIDKDMNIIACDENSIKSTVKGDCNGDGVLGVADAVTLQKWLLRKKYTDISEFGYADANNDGVIDVYDLIFVRKELIKKLSGDPKPVLVEISENYSDAAAQTVRIYDQYGTMYEFRYEETKADLKKYIEDNTILWMKGDNWYDKMLDIIDKANESPEDKVLWDDMSKPLEEYCVAKAAVPDGFVDEVNDFAKNTEALSKEKMKETPKSNDMGETTFYIIGEDSEGNHVWAAIVESGDFVGWIDNDITKTFIRSLKRNGFVGYDIVKLLDK